MSWHAVPDLVSDFIRDGRVSIPAEVRFSGAFLTADIVGFTALAETLAAQGARGAERVAEVVNPYFDRLVGAIARHGGHVHRFAGDAVLAVWPARDGDQSAAEHRALAAGAEIAAAVQPVPDAGRAIAMRVGVAAGPLWAGAVGGPTRAEVLLSGDPVDASAHAASRAPASGLAVPSALAEGIAGLERSPLDEGWTLVHAVPDPPEAPSWTRRDGDISAFVPEGMDPTELADGSGATLVGTGGTSWDAELRRAHVAFVNLPGLRLSEAGALERAQAATEAMFATLRRFDGRVVQYLAEGAGATLVAAWGLPGNASEDGATRALRAGLEVRDALRAAGLAVRVGVATGTTLVALRGGRTRYEPGIFGRTVNLAARIMQSCDPVEGGVACAEVTAGESRGIDVEPANPVRVKGVDGPVAVRRVRGRRAAGGLPEHRQARSSLGRAAELEVVESLLDEAAGRAATLVVEGEAGSGKSLLLSEAITAAERRGFEVLIGGGEASEADTPFYAWRPVFRGLLRDVPDADLVPALEDRLRTEYGRRRVPLLAPVLPIPSDDNEVTAQLAGRPRFEASRRVMLELLAHAPAPRLVVIDDAHWIDSASRALASHVARHLDRGLLAVGTRPGSGIEAEIGPSGPQRRMERMVLPPLGRTETAALVARTLDAREAQAALVDRVFDRSQGNPFFATQIALGLCETGRTAVRDGRAVLVDAPDPEPDYGTVQAVLVARIDRVPTRSERVLKAASVLGATVDREALESVWPDARDGSALVPLTEAGLLATGGAGGAVLSFAHPLIRDAAYGLLTFAQRRELHGRAARHVEVRAEDDERQAALLSHHYLAAEEFDRALPHLERAGAHARRTFSSREVVAFFSRAQEAARRIGLRPDSLRTARWERAIGEAKLKMLDFDASQGHLAEALVHLGFPAPRTAGQRVRALLVELLVQTFRRYFPRRAPAPATIADRCLEAADLLELEDEIHWYRNDALGLTLGAFRQLNLAERAHLPSPQLAQAYASVSVPTSLVGMHGLARKYVARSEELLPGVASMAARAYSLLTLTVYYQAYAAWEDVERTVTQSRDLFAEIGDHHRHQQTLAVETVLHLHRGALGVARERALALEATVGPDDPPQFLSWTVPTRVAAGMVDGTLAESTVDELDALSRRELQGGELMLVLGSLAEALEYLGAHDRSREAATRALAHADSQMPSTYYGLRGYSGLAHAWTRLLARATRSGAPDARSVEKSCRRALKHLKAFARAFPVGVPAARLHAARLETARGSSAAPALADALERAERLGLPWDAALAAAALPDTALDPARREAPFAALRASERFRAFCAPS